MFLLSFALVVLLCATGDILRATGNLAGKSASMVMRKVGKGIGNGVSNMTHSLGDGIEDATGKIGAKKLGAGVNSVISGVGDGVGNTLTGGKNLVSLSCDPCSPMKTNIIRLVTSQLVVELERC